MKQKTPVDLLAEYQLKQLAIKANKRAELKENLQSIKIVLGFILGGIIAACVIIGGVLSFYHLGIKEINIEPRIEYRTNMIYAPYFVPINSNTLHNTIQYKQP